MDYEPKQTELTTKEKRVVFCIFVVVMGVLFLMILDGYGVLL